MKRHAIDVLVGTQRMRNLANWIQKYVDDIWDKQIEKDLHSGKLDRLIARSEADYSKIIAGAKIKIHSTLRPYRSQI